MSRNQGEFFLIVAPGLEALALAELDAKVNQLRGAIPNSDIKEIRWVAVGGGIEFHGPLGLGWALNSYLKIPTRILQRVASFSAKDFPKLYSRLVKVPWNNFFRQGVVDVKVAVAASRLKMKDRVRQTALEAIGEAQKHQAFRKPHLDVPQTIFLRIDENQVIVSVDTSGDALYLRGYKPMTVSAPIRETLASFLYFACRQKLTEDPAVVIDPMCGSGTLIFESLMFWMANSKRKYACQNFPYAPAFMNLDLRPLEKSSVKSMGFGFDLDAKAIAAAEENAKTLGARNIKFQVAEAPNIDWKDQGRPSVLLVNPPYNERIRADKEAVLSALNKTAYLVKPDVIGLVWPGEAPPKVLADRPLQEFYRTKNGGIEIALGVY